MPAKPLAIVLGGTNPHIPLIENLRKRGYYVLLVDYLDAPPAKRVADEHAQVSTLAMEEVLALARERKAALVIAACVDRANVTATFVAEQLGLPAPYASATAKLIANKLTMKERLVSLGVPTAAFCVLNRQAPVQRPSIGFPVVAKPIDTGGSKGVRKAENLREFRQAAEEAFKVSCGAEILVEAFCAGVEVSADCMVQNGELRILMLRQKYIQRVDGGAVLSAYASVSPPGVSLEAKERMLHAATDIVRGFELQTTPLLVQFMVNGNDVRVIEFAPRVGGGLNYRVVLLRTGIDMLDASINAYLGRPTILSSEGRDGYLATHHVYTVAGCFGEVRNQNRLMQAGVIEEFYVHKSPRARLRGNLTSADRAASFIVHAASADELPGKAKEAIDTLDVVDHQGRSIMRRDIFLSAL